MKPIAMRSIVMRGLTLAMLSAPLAGCATAGELSQGQKWIMQIENQYARDGAQGFSPWQNFPVERLWPTD